MADDEINQIMEIEEEESLDSASSSVSDFSDEDDGEIGDLGEEMDVGAAAEHAEDALVPYHHEPPPRQPGQGEGEDRAGAAEELPPPDPEFLRNVQNWLLLAALHWNENADRDQAVRADGTPLFKRTFQKAKDGRPTISRVLTLCTYGYVDQLMKKTISLVSRREKIRTEIQELDDKPSLASKHERPDRDEAICQAETHRRFAI